MLMMVSQCIVGQKVRRLAGSSASLSLSDSAPFSASALSLVLPSFGCPFCGSSNQIVSFLVVLALVFMSADRFIRFSLPA